MEDGKESILPANSLAFKKCRLIIWPCSANETKPS